MGINLVLLPDYLNENTLERIKDHYGNKENNSDYHVSTYPEGALVRGFWDSKELFDINELVCVASKEELKNYERTLDILKCGLSRDKMKFIELEGDKDKDNSKLENLLNE